MSFPSGFVWGAAAASYQIEGAAHEDGRGLSVWDMFCRKDGAIFSGQDGDVACDHYHRWREDIQLMKEMGLKAYRLSISWSQRSSRWHRQANEQGLEFYDRLIDGLLEAGITPYVTLFHWDYPYALYCRGGWLNRESVDWFAAYTKLIARAARRSSHPLDDVERAAMLSGTRPSRWHPGAGPEAGVDGRSAGDASRAACAWPRRSDAPRTLRLASRSSAGRR